MEAGKRLLPYAKGFPVDNKTHWYCSCGTLNDGNDRKCCLCEQAKSEIFSNVTNEKLIREKQVVESEEKIKEEERKKREKKLSFKILKVVNKLKDSIKKVQNTEKVLNCIACFAAMLTIVSLFIPLLSGISVNGFDFLSFKNPKNLFYSWTPIVVGIIVLLQLIASSVFIIINVLKIFLRNKRYANLIADITIITCLAFNIIYMIVGIINVVTFKGRYGTLSYLALIINIIVTIAYFIFKKSTTKKSINK